MLDVPYDGVNCDILQYLSQGHTVRFFLKVILGKLSNPGPQEQLSCLFSN